MFNWKVFAAEFVGTFALVLIGAGAGASNAGLLGVALAHGLTLAVFVYAFGHISGTHVNPAVTFGLALQGAIKWSDAIFYWLAQCAGAILAGGMLHMVATALGGTIDAGATVGLLTDKFPMYAMMIEAVLTFLLVTTVLNTAVAGRGGNMAGFAIGMTLAAAILVGGPLTGASLNPARTLGTAVFTLPSLAQLNTYVIYLLGPFLGAAAAALLYNFMSKPDSDAEPIKVQAPVRKTAAKSKN